jgi:hypothetical protein
MIGNQLSVASGEWRGIQDALRLSTLRGPGPELRQRLHPHIETPMKHGFGRYPPTKWCRESAILVQFLKATNVCAPERSSGHAGWGENFTVSLPFLPFFSW